VEKCVETKGNKDNCNVLYKGTYVLRGNAKAQVFGVGRQTQIGSIANMLEDEDAAKTPLEKSLDKLGKILSAFVLLVAAIIFVMGIFVRGDGVLNTFMTALAVAVAAIPEGLPAVVTIIMAMGVQRMSKQNVVIRKLKCVETLGGCTCICTDKTGTLTQNKMRVVKVFADLSERSLKDSSGSIAILAECGAICTNVATSQGKYIGDPTEVAIRQYSDNFFNWQFTQITQIPFTSERKMMSVLASINDSENLSHSNKRLYVKGAPDVLIKCCTRIIVNGEVRQLTEIDIAKILDKNDEMSDNALRVLAFAYRDGEELEESNLIFIGLCGMIDGLKEGVKTAVAECKRAGITTVMITGDHARTAYAIAKQAGIVDNNSNIYTGEQLDNMTKAQRVQAIRNGVVFARVTPKHKNLIVKVKKNNGEVVAMTGDGVNDAPSIKSADIGIAMGICGTDVTKGAADMVIADDNFTTIVSAVREGRRISSNVIKTIQFFLSTNLAEVFCILIASIAFFRYDFLYSTQLLWINLITDSFPVLALGVEKGDIDVMSHPPQRAQKALYSKSSCFIIAISGLYISAATMFIYALSLSLWGNAVATTTTFLTISFLELFQAFNIRTEKTSNFGKHAFSNKVLLSTVLVGVAVNVVLIFSPLCSAFSLVRLNALQWLAVTLASLSVLPFGELYKLMLRRNRNATKGFNKHFKRLSVINNQKNV
jgi:Ca2+-transporting ATPase